MGSQLCAVAGTLESNDILITISALEKPGDSTVQLESIVMSQFGESIQAVIHDCLEKSGLTNVRVDAKDKGALECTIRARMEAAIAGFRRAQ